MFVHPAAPGEAPGSCKGSAMMPSTAAGGKPNLAPETTQNGGMHELMVRDAFLPGLTHRAWSRFTGAHFPHLTVPL
jgi:hypothetical protein